MAGIDDVGPLELVLLFFGGLFGNGEIDYLVKAPLVDDLAMVLVIGEGDLVVGMGARVLGLDAPDALAYRLGLGYRPFVDRCPQRFDIR